MHETALVKERGKMLTNGKNTVIYVIFYNMIKVRKAIKRIECVC